MSIKQLKQINSRGALNNDTSELLRHIETIRDHLVEQEEHKEEEWKVIWDAKLKEVEEEKKKVIEFIKEKKYTQEDID